MVGWSISVFQIISTLIGSGFTIFALNSIVYDLNQPQVNMNILTNNDGLTPGNMSDTNNINNKYNNKENNNSEASTSITTTRYEIITTNNGRLPATNLILSLSYPYGNITDYSVIFQSENITMKQQSSSLLLAELKRLSSGSVFAISTTVDCYTNGYNNNKSNAYLSIHGSIGNNKKNTNCHQPNYFIATASHDHGSKFESNMNSSIINTDEYYILHYRKQVILLLMTFAGSFFVIALSFKRVNRFRKRLNRSKFVFDIVKEIVGVRDTLVSNITSKRFFPYDIWSSKDLIEKRKIFYDYGDYNYIDDFYSKIRERDSILSRKSLLKEIKNIPETSLKDPINNEIYSGIDENKNILKNSNSIYNNSINVQRLNEESLTLANETLNKIDWTSYQDIEDKKYFLPLAIIITVVSSLLVSSVLEVYRLTFLQIDLEMSNFFHLLLIYVFVYFIRSLVFFLLAREILNFQTLFAYEIGVNKEILTFFILDKKTQVRLLLLSLILMGLPIFSFVNDFKIFSEEIDLFSTNSSQGYIIFLIEVLVDTLRFAILTFVLPKATLKNIIKVTRL